MKSLLIQDTTQEERQKIVEEALGFLGACDDCQGGLGDCTTTIFMGSGSWTRSTCPSGQPLSGT